MLVTTQPFEIQIGTLSFQGLEKWAMSEEEFFQFCQINRELRIERDQYGTISIMPPTGGETGRRNSSMNAVLYIWNQNAQSGFVFDSSTGFVLPNGAMRSPDAAWVSIHRWEALTPAERQKFPPLCPDFVIELRSNTDALPTLLDKMREYIDNGCQLAWLIDPQHGEARVFRADGTISRVTDFSQLLSGEEVLPGFELSLSLFR